MNQLNSPDLLLTPDEEFASSASSGGDNELGRGLGALDAVVVSPVEGAGRGGNGVERKKTSSTTTPSVAKKSRFNEKVEK